MQTEDIATIKQSEVTFQTRTKNSFFIRSRPSSAHSYTCRHPTYRIAHVCQFGRYNKPTFFILPCSRFALTHSGTFLIVPFWWMFYIANICLQYSARLFSETLLYRKPAYHHSCWLTQRCQMYQAQDKPSQSFAVTKEEQLASQSLSQRCRLERPHWERRLRRE